MSNTDILRSNCANSFVLWELATTRYLRNRHIVEKFNVKRLMLFSSHTESGVEDKKLVTQTLVNISGAAYQKCSRQIYH